MTTARTARSGVLDTASPAAYWEARADRFANEGEGLRAVCSYGMPAFYNRAIHWTQAAALRPFLKPAPGTSVLDVGCGVGRWSRRLAAAGARVTGVDISATMLAEARRRAADAGLAESCRFVQADLSTLDLDRRFDQILGVTVLQHILRPVALIEAIRRLRRHLAPGGELVLLEAMPSRLTSRCDSPVFTARTWDLYRRLFEGAGFEIARLGGVDPAPFKILFLPFYSRMPRGLAQVGLAAATALGLPIDVAFGRAWTRASWHKVVVLRHGR